MSDDTQRVLGAHDAKLDTHTERLDKIEAKLDEVLAKLQQTEGAWRALLGVSALSSALTAAAFKVWGVMKGGA